MNASAGFLMDIKRTRVCHGHRPVEALPFKPCGTHRLKPDRTGSLRRICPSDPNAPIEAQRGSSIGTLPDNVLPEASERPVLTDLEQAVRLDPSQQGGLRDRLGRDY
jgi:hypothetical protein